MSIAISSDMTSNDRMWAVRINKMNKEFENEINLQKKHYYEERSKVIKKYKNVNFDLYRFTGEHAHFKNVGVDEIHVLGRPKIQLKTAYSKDIIILQYNVTLKWLLEVYLEEGSIVLNDLVGYYRWVG